MKIGSSFLRWPNLLIHNKKRSKRKGWERKLNVKKCENTLINFVSLEIISNFAAGESFTTCSP